MSEWIVNILVSLQIHDQMSPDRTETDKNVSEVTPDALNISFL